MSAVGVVTLNKGRRSHLVELLRGLARGLAPDACAVVQMDEDRIPLPDQPYPVRPLAFASQGLPLAAARNAGRRALDSETLVFLDVDCIPSSGLVAGFRAATREVDGLVCCPVGYLPADAALEDWTEERLDRAARSHPERSFPDRGLRRIDDPGLFWSLAFAVRAATFDRLGGFDERFVGYGAEDTDLAFRAAGMGIPLIFAGGFRAYHQHHPSYDPPLQHFDDIVRNAWLFRARHGVWPMGGWLDAFARLGLTETGPGGDVAVRRRPTLDEIAAARLPPDRVV